MFAHHKEFELLTHNNAKINDRYQHSYLHFGFPWIQAIVYDCAGKRCILDSIPTSRLRFNFTARYAIFSTAIEDAEFLLS